MKDNRMSSAYTLEQIFDDIEKGEEGKNTITMGYIVRSLNSRGFGPLVCVLSLIMILPTGAIPGMPIIMGMLISLVTIQLAIGRKTPWIPQRIEKITVRKSSLQKGVQKVRPAIRKVLRYTHKRMEIMLDRRVTALIALICTVLALSMIPLGLVPFLVMVPASIIFIFGVAITMHDGLLIAIGIGLVAAFAGSLPFFI